MPYLESDPQQRQQPAVLWASTGFPDRYGVMSLAVPIQIWVKWNTTRRRILDAKGNLTALDAEVVVDRLIPLESKMYRGTLSNWLGTGSDLPENELMEVKEYKECWSDKGRCARRTVGLVKFRGAMPAGAG